MVAITHAVFSFLPLFPNTKHLWIMTDDSTSVLRQQTRGKNSPVYSKLAIEICEICIKHLPHLSAAHIPGKHNVAANWSCCKFQDSAEWMISTDTFDELCSIFSITDIDLFASWLKKQLDHWASWLPDLGSCIIDGMSVSWHGQYVYIFPPFSMIWHWLPKWTTQPWFPLLLQLALVQPREKNSTTVLGTKKTTPPQPQVKTSSSFMFQQHQGARNFSGEATNLLT